MTQVCPHRVVSLPNSWSEYHAGRCPACRLLIGAGRAVSEDEAGGGTATGFVANAARRSNSEAGDIAVVLAALRRAAHITGCPVERLRMTDYDRIAAADEALPSLGVVLATSATWKTARMSAANDARHADLAAYGAASASTNAERSLHERP